MKVLLITDDEQDLATFANLGVEPTPQFTQQEWDEAPHIFLGLDRLADVAFCTRRPAGVHLIGKDFDDASVWTRAVEAGAENVLFFPDALPYVQARLTDVPARTVP